MASSKNSKIISKASPHTIMKFKLIEEYVKAWAQKLMLNSSCYGLVFIDCMCNSGVYTYNGETQVRREAAKEKYANTYLTDFEKLIPFAAIILGYKLQ